MEKPVWQSKTIWTAALVAVYALARYFGVEAPVTDELVYSVLGAFGLYSLRDAVGKQKK